MENIENLELRLDRLEKRLLKHTCYETGCTHAAANHVLTVDKLKVWICDRHLKRFSGCYTLGRFGRKQSVIP